MAKTVNDFIKELQNLKPELRSKPLKIIAPNGLKFEPKVKRLVSEHQTIFDEAEEMVVTWE